jgi:hypothetical protein
MTKTKITQEQMDFMGITDLESKIYPKRHFVPLVGDVELHESTTISDVLKLIWESGNRIGQKQGEKRKMQEIKNVLEIYD